MSKNKWTFLLFVILPSFATLANCAFVPVTPCQSGGEPARETGMELIGTRKCTQWLNEKGEEKNHGLYREWYTSEKIALIGEYAWGRKNGRWIYFNPLGIKTHEKYFLNGVQVTEEAFRQHRLKMIMDPHALKGEDASPP